MHQQTQRYCNTKIYTIERLNFSSLYCHYISNYTALPHLTASAQRWHYSGAVRYEIEICIYEKSVGIKQQQTGHWTGHTVQVGPAGWLWLLLADRLSDDTVTSAVRTLAENMKKERTTSLRCFTKRKPHTGRRKGRKMPFLSLVTLNFKLIKARDQTRLLCDYGAKLFSSSWDISYTNTRTHQEMR